MWPQPADDYLFCPDCGNETLTGERGSVCVCTNPNCEREEVAMTHCDVCLARTPIDSLTILGGEAEDTMSVCPWCARDHRR